MVTVEVDPVRVESRLWAGEIECPCCPGGVLGGWGHARSRPVAGAKEWVRPRRARCRGCRSTHVLLPVSLLLRRAYLARWIFSALVAKSRGDGHRPIAARLGVPASTVRGWLRALACKCEQVRIWFLGIAMTAGVDISIPKASGSAWIDLLAAVGAATRSITTRFGLAGILGVVTAPGVAVAGSGGRLLAPGWPENSGRRSATPVAPAGTGVGAQSSST